MNRYQVRTTNGRTAKVLIQSIEADNKEDALAVATRRFGYDPSAFACQLTPATAAEITQFKDR